MSAPQIGGGISRLVTLSHLPSGNRTEQGVQLGPDISSKTAMMISFQTPVNAKGRESWLLESTQVFSENMLD